MEGLEVAHQVQAQDVEVTNEGTATVRRGVAAERRVSIADAEMRHGRKGRSQRVEGDKRLVLRDLDTKLVRAVGVTVANVPDARVTDDSAADRAHQPVTLRELHIDRASLSRTLVRERPADLQISCTAWPVRNGDRFPKTAFVVDWQQGTIRCPNDVTVPFTVDGVVRLPTEAWVVCPYRAHWTRSKQGRSVAIHPDERLLQDQRERQQSPAGRAKLRERVAVEHALAPIGRWQGRRACYRGQRKNLFDLRRAAVVHNLHVLQRSQDTSQQEAA